MSDSTPPHDPWSSDHGDEAWRTRRPTGLLARIATAQATHPKRTVFGGLGFFIVICILAFGPLRGTLENKFVIPGSDVQTASDVLEGPRSASATVPSFRS